MLKSINKSIEQTINTLIDITTYSRFGVPVRAIDIANRQHLSLSRIEVLLLTLKSACLIRAAKGCKGGYYISKDPHSMTMKDVFLAVNYNRARKILIDGFAKEIIDSFESYMRDCLTKITAISSVPNVETRPFDIEALSKWNEQRYQIQKNPKNKKLNTQSILITKAEIRKAEKLGPNSIFDLSNYC